MFIITRRCLYVNFDKSIFIYFLVNINISVGKSMLADRENAFYHDIVDSMDLWIGFHLC